LKAYIRVLRGKAGSLAKKRKGVLSNDEEKQFADWTFEANWLKLQIDERPATDSFLNSEVEIKNKKGHWVKQYIRLKKFSMSKAMLIFGDRDAVM